jgi:hypothetical protein
VLSRILPRGRQGQPSARTIWAENAEPSAVGGESRTNSELIVSSGRAGQLDDRLSNGRSASAKRFPRPSSNWRTGQALSDIPGANISCLKRAGNRLTKATSPVPAGQRANMRRRLISKSIVV